MSVADGSASSRLSDQSSRFCCCKIFASLRSLTMPQPITPRHIPSGAKGRDFEQAISTPVAFVDAVHAHATIELDPFCDATNAGHTRARRSYVFPTQSGLALPWTPAQPQSWHVYANPPFAELGLVLAHAVSHSWRGGFELTMLLPLRSHRRYWHHVYSSDACVELFSFAFAGFETKFPMPCVLVYWGERAEQWADRMRQFGTVTRTRPLTGDLSGIMMRSVTKKHDMPSWLRARAVEVVRQAAQDGLSVGDLMSVGSQVSLDALVIDALRTSPVLDACMPRPKAGPRSTSSAQTKARRVTHTEPQSAPEPAVSATDPREVPVATGSPKARYSSYLAGVKDGDEVRFDEVHRQVGEGVSAPTVRRWLLAETCLERLAPARPMRFRKQVENAAS